MGKNFSTNRKRGLRNKSDFYQTPYSITKQLLDNEIFVGKILEPAKGDGAIVKILEEYNYNVIGSDKEFDFFKYIGFFDNIITNPPFSLANEFIDFAKKIYLDKIAMLLPLSYLHGQKRYNLNIFNELKNIYVFTRYPLLIDKIRDDGKYNTGMMVYAWYVWKKGNKNPPIIKWLDNNEYVLTKYDKDNK